MLKPGGVPITTIAGLNLFISWFFQQWAATPHYAKQPTNVSIAALKKARHYAAALLAAKTPQKPLKCAVAQSSGPFFGDHTRSVSSAVAELYCTTLSISGIPLCYTTLTATISVAAHRWFVSTDGRLVLLDWFFLVVAVFFVLFFL
jgi:hypothetical protein